jgi:hypothetical protein
MVLMALLANRDWPGLLMNLGSGIIGAVIILFIIDRRYRPSEIQKLVNVNRDFHIYMLLIVSIYHRQRFRYVRSFLAQLEYVLSLAITRNHFDDHYSKLDHGFVLVGPPGAGKTTLLQLMALRQAQRYLQQPESQKIPILLPLRRWRSIPRLTPMSYRSPSTGKVRISISYSRYIKRGGEGLEDFIFEHINNYGIFSRRSFRLAFERGQVICILDGADEVGDVLNAAESNGSRKSEFLKQFEELREKYPRVAWTMSTRPDGPIPASHMEIVDLPPLTDDESHEIRAKEELYQEFATTRKNQEFIEINFPWHY